MPDYEKLTDDLRSAHAEMLDHERGGRVLRADECYNLGLLLECAWQTIMQLRTVNEILEARINALDPEGSRRRLAMQQSDGLSPFEEAPRSQGERSSPTRRPARESQFRNL